MKKSFLLNFYHDSHTDCRKSIIKLIEHNPKAKYLDCGCDDGAYTSQVADEIGTKNVYGIETVKAASDKARKKGISIDSSNLNKKFPYGNDSFDVVTANQVIEHLYGTDNFVKEIYRILKTDGYAIISTNNLASWHNFIALIFGKQPFPSDVSNNAHGIGKLFPLFDGDCEAWSHLRIFTHASLKGIFEHYGFKVENIVGVGYYPLPSAIAKVFTKFDKRHAAYLTIKVRKI